MPSLVGDSRIPRDPDQTGDLLRAYVSAPSDADAATALNLLFRDYIGPWCAEAARRTLRNYGVRGTDQADEESEVAAEVMLQMTSRLQEQRRASSPPIGNLRAYAVTSVSNACFARVRARCPRHVQLQNRIRYLLRNDRRFAAWTSGRGEPMAGLRAWEGREDHVPPPVLQRSAEPLPELLENVFGAAAGPVRLSDLNGAVAESLGIVENTFARCAEGAAAEHVSPAPAADHVLMERQSLAALWSEVLLLPQSQRVALLLNLRDGGGNGVIELIPATGIASFDQLAGILDLSPAALAAIWADLPLEDARIAGMLGVSRQQVINLRKSARDRLARRQRKDRGNTGSASASGKGLAARDI